MSTYNPDIRDSADAWRWPEHDTSPGRPQFAICRTCGVLCDAPEKGEAFCEECLDESRIRIKDFPEGWVTLGGGD